MKSKVLAISADGSLSYCTSAPERRGRGNCPHIYHQMEGQSDEEFLSEFSFALNPVTDSDSGRSNEEITRELIENNKLSFNENPDWTEVVTPKLLGRFLRLGDSVFDGKCVVKVETNEYGDLVDHLYIVGTYEGYEFSFDAKDERFLPCDFGTVPHIRDDGTFTIKGVEYRCLPVVSRNKVGYGQGYTADGKPVIWIYQEDNENLAITIPMEGDTCRILGKDYPKSEIEEAINNPPHKDPNVQLLLSCIDPMVKERYPEFGQGQWMQKMFDNFKADEVNDIENRRIFTYKDIVRKEYFDQIRRMGVTFRQGITKNGVPLLYQKNNTENITKTLLARSNVQMADTLNPLAAYSQSHKVSLVGIGGYNKDNCPDKLRMVGDSLRGISDPLDQSSGKGIGLSIFLKGADVKNGVIVKDPSKECFSLTDFVPYLKHNNPNRASMATSQMRQAMRLKYGEDPRRLGDPTSDKAWAQISGAKLGVNFNVAYVTGEYEWEDSCRVSESAAKRLITTKTFNFQKDDRYKDGYIVHPGDKIAGKTVKYEGTLRETSTGFTMTVDVPFTNGNKIAGRYGNKCTAYVVPDSEMPQVWDRDLKKYVPADVTMSPLSTGKRGNLGAILETQNDSLSSKDILPVKLPNGSTVIANNGKQYIMRLNQISQEKNHAYSDELTTGREAKARFGEMESILMTTTEKRRKVLEFLKNQETDEASRLDSLLKAIGVCKKE